MNASIARDDYPLQERIDDAQDKLGGLEEHLEAIDRELSDLAEQREKFELVEQACSSLEQLHSLGAAELFWGQDVDRSQVAGHVYRVRQSIAGFLGQIAEIESRRQAVVDEIEEGRRVLAILEDEFAEHLEEEEERLQEWVVEREIGPVPMRLAVMPWIRGGEDDLRFRKSLGATLAAALLLGLLLPLVDLPVPERDEIIEVPERLVRLIQQERRPVPPPQQAIIEETVAQEPEPVEPEPIVEPTPPPEPTVAEQRPEPEAPPAPQPAPRERAEASGILAFRESFSSLAQNRPSARLGADARISNAGDAALGRPERSMVATQAPGSSGGINLASISRDVGAGDGGGPQIAGVATARVASAIGAGSGTDDRPLAGGSASAGRTDEEIQIVFDRYKASLYRLYNRELRQNPTLRGQMVLRLTIEPDGSVSFCVLESSDMNAPALADQVVERVRTFDFGAKDVSPITIVYPIDFLPAA